MNCEPHDGNAFEHASCEICGWDSVLHVECDNNCLALNEPATIEEYKAALAHWKDHESMHGCSHGC